MASDFGVTIPGDPVAQGRPRAAVVNGKPRLYDPKNSAEWKGLARQIIRSKLASDEILHPEGPLSLAVWAFHRCPKGDHRVREPAPRRWRDKRPDVDNVVKAVKDAATGLLWHDDSQVAVLHAYHVTAAQDEQPKVVVQVRALEPEVPFTGNRKG